MKKIVLLMLCLLPLMQACEPEGDYATAFSWGSGKVSVSLALQDMPATTRSSLGPGVEDIDSGYSVVVSFHDSHKVEGVYEVGEDGMIEVTAGVPLDLYVVGNLWYINADGKRKSYLAMHGASMDFPYYRLDGKSVGDGFRTENFSELAGLGIPYSGSLESVTVTQGMTLSIPVERMLAKVSVSVDHSGLTGGRSGIFKDSSIRLCQASCLLHPFVPVKAVSAEDMLPAGDYEPELSSSEKTEYTLYVPENISGITLENAIPSGKTRDALLAQGRADVEPYLTYVEFCGDLNPSCGGYGGETTYRFYLGKDNVKDFNVVRNNDYHITLGFRAGSLFDPYWKVETGDDFKDSRIIAFAEDLSGSKLLDEGRTVAVRKNRPAFMYLYFNREGEIGVNQYQSLDEYTEGYDPSDASHSACSWSAEGLEQYGMSCCFDRTSGKMTVSVTDPSRFVAGKTVPVTLTLWPGGRKYIVNVVTYDDISVSGNLKEFYMGMSRQVTLEGFAGNSFHVVGKDPGVIKLSSSDDAAFVGAEPLKLPGRTAALFAFGKSPGMALTVGSDDAFNDGGYTMTFPVYQPCFNSERRSVRLFVDGTGVPLASPVYKDRNGVAMDRSDFDAELYENLLALKQSWSSEYGDMYASLDDEEIFIDYLGDGDTWIGNHLDDGDKHNVHPDFLGSVSVKPVSDLFTEWSKYDMTVYLPYVRKHFPASVLSDYFNTYGPGEVTLESEYVTYGNSNLIFYSEADGRVRTAIEKTPDPDVSLLRWQAGDTIDQGYVPYGLQTVYYGFFNRRAVSGIVSRVTKTNVALSYNVKLGQFAVFDKGPLMKVYVIYPKAAWQMKQYFEGTQGSQMPVWNSVCGISAYNNYLTYSYFQTIATGQQQRRTGNGNTRNFYYYDFFSGTYPTMTYWDEVKAATVSSSLPWLIGLSLIDHTNLSGGNPYFNISLSGEKIGYVFIK